MKNTSSACPEYAQLLGITNEMRLHLGALVSFLSTCNSHAEVRERAKADMELIEIKLQAAKELLTNKEWSVKNAAINFVSGSDRVTR